MNLFRALYRIFLEPKYNATDEWQQEFILNIILVTLIVGLSILASVAIFYAAPAGYDGINFWFLSGFIVLIGGLLWLSRSGMSQLATHGLILILIAATTYASFIWGANFQHALLGSVLVIAIASVLVGTAYSFVVAGIISIITLLLWDLQIKAIVQPHWFWEYPLQFHHATDFVILFFTITGVLWLSNRKITYRVRRLNTLYRFAKVGKLSSGIFHDLANPLTAVTLSIEHLKEYRFSSTKELKQHVDQALQAIDRMRTLMTAISTHIREPVAEAIMFSVTEEIEKAVTILAYKSRVANVQIELRNGKEIFLHGSPLRFHQAIVNIIANAIDACEENELGLPRVCTITYTEEATTVTIRISNTGPKIREELMKKIFDPFFTTKPYERGNGIGLSIVKEIVEAEFGGSIHVASSDQETAFRLLFPIKKDIQPLAQG